MSDVLMSADSLTCGYGKIAVVRDLDLQVRAGEILTLLGPNGAGKTTTMLTMSGELPALGGTVTWEGQPTRAPLYKRVRDGLGIVSEERVIMTQGSVADNFKLNRGDTAMALELFPELEPHLDRRVGLLSGGQQQMLALAKALCRKPKVLLADELSLGLAPLVVSRLLRAVREAADRGVGVVLVEQHVHKALEVADKVVVMRRGSVVLSGDASDLRNRVDDIQNAYLAASGADDEEVDELAPAAGA
jgi:ABC-type branched-subunit amino acid transport system ATPase component